MEENDKLAEASLLESDQLMSESDYVGHPEGSSALFFQAPSDGWQVTRAAPSRPLAQTQRPFVSGERLL